MQVNVAGLRRNIKNLAHNYSDAQVKVREATSNDPWGPSTAVMAEISDLTYNVVAFSEIMQMIWKRLNDHGKNWRHVYKALILLEYLIKTGTEKVAQQCKENIYAIQTLREFVYFEEGKDQGTHVRERAKQLVNLLKDDERLKNERVKALTAKERFAQHPSGFGSDGYIDGPTHRDMPPGWQEEPAKPVSELEMVRPQTAGEEELQLQLAMAMSREEAEQEEAKRRSDDVRLQLALSQSEQDFKDQTVKPTTKKEEQQSHLLDLLDISLGATSISSPPLGATGGNGDPWGTPARAASQLSDPWSGTSSPQIDPWQPAASMRMASASAPLGAIGGIGSGGSNGTNGGEAWALTRTQSPSVASGSSAEGWLHSNGGGGGGAYAAVGGVGASTAAALNGNSISVNAGAGAGAAAIGGVDPWLSKRAGVGVALGGGVEKVEPADPWLNETVKPVNMAHLAAAAPAATKVDPWAPKAGAALNEDPWKSTETTVGKKPSPDLDEFDIITNRNKTGDLLTNNSASNASNNNNNASLLDEMDPLSATNSSLNTSSTNAKKQLKTPQSFLGENSSLVNLDNLIKPVQTQPQAGNAAYNPFSDTVVPPKTNLFQQQQPAVPSINQLKQQQPFAMTINQDPWAPVNNTTNASQSSRNYFNDYESDDFTSFQSINNGFNNNNNNNNTNNKMSKLQMGSSNNNKQTLQYSKSDYDVFNTSYGASSDFFNYNNNTNNTNNNNKNSNNRYDGPHQFQTQVQIHSQSVDNIRNMQISSDSSDTDAAYEKSSTTTIRPQQQQQQQQQQNVVAAASAPFSSNFTTKTHSATLLQQPLAPTTTQKYQTFAADFNAVEENQDNFFNMKTNNNSNPLTNPYTSTFGLATMQTDAIYQQQQQPQQQQPTAPVLTNYSNALTAALADTPGIKIAPMQMMQAAQATLPTSASLPIGFSVVGSQGGTADGLSAFDSNMGAGIGGGYGGGTGGGSLFNYGFYEANSNYNNSNAYASSNNSAFSAFNTSTTNSNNNVNNNNALFSSISHSTSLGNCKLENNNNMPWMNTEAASSSNPFLS